MKTKIIIDSCSIHGETEFYIIKKSRRDNGYQRVCKKCSIERTTKRRQNNKQRATEYLGGSCSVCGYNKCNAALEFHHKDPNEKDIEPAKLFSKNWKNIQPELDKCILLCTNCHKTIHQGTITGRPIGKSRTERTTKMCNTHGETEHYKKKNGVWKCCKCNSEAVRKSLNKSREKVFEYMGSVCSICSTTNTYLMEFHHKTPKDKELCISDSMKLTWNKIQPELDKCIMVCGNCHREIHNGLTGET